MKRILLTGASGFVGRQIAHAIAGRGHHLTLVMRPRSEIPRGLAADALDIVETKDAFGENADWWADRLRGIDTVIHAAWYVEPGLYLDSQANIDCARGSLALADGVVRTGVRHFIGIGTCFEYRLPNDAITAASAPGPVTLYAAAKLALFHMLRRRMADSETRLSWARLFYLFGEGEHPARLFPTLHRKLANGERMMLSSGDKVRDFLDVAEAGRLIATVAETRQPGIVNICSGKPTTIRAVAETIADLYGARELLEFGHAVVHPRDPAAVAGCCNVEDA